MYQDGSHRSPEITIFVSKKKYGATFNQQKLLLLKSVPYYREFTIIQLQVDSHGGLTIWSSCPGLMYRVLGSMGGGPVLTDLVFSEKQKKNR